MCGSKIFWGKRRVAAITVLLQETVQCVLEPGAVTPGRKDKGKLSRGGARMESDCSTRDFRLM